MIYIFVAPSSPTTNILVLKKERKQFQYLSHFEVDTPKTAEEKWSKVVKDALLKAKETCQDLKSEHKIIVRLPWSLLTTRFLKLPVVGKKKVDMMLPFQLEESIPFAISKAHITTNQQKIKNETEIMANITKRDEFQELYDELIKENVVPHLLCAPQSCLNNMLEWIYNDKIKESFKPIVHQNCLIIDWDSTGLLCSMICNSKLIGSSSFYFTEEELVKKVANQYGIPGPEASVYLSKEAFFLPKAQWDHVRPNQKEFAKLMEHWTHPMISEIKRWLLAYRVKCNVEPEFIYITGKMSGIMNFDVYLSETLKKKVLYLDFNRTIKSMPHTLYPRFGSLATMVLAHYASTNIPNFLRGDFSPGQSKGLPWNSMAFNFARVAIVALLFSFFGLLENAFLMRDQKVVTSQLNGLLKGPTLALTKNDERKYTKSSKGLLPIVQKRAEMVTQEVNSLQSAGAIDTSGMLVRVSQLLGNNEQAQLLSYRCDGQTASFLFDAKNTDEIKAIDNKLRSAGLPIKHLAPTDKSTQLVMELRVK